MIRLYGEKVSDYVYDCAALLGGIMVSFSIYLLISPSKEINLDEFADYLLRRMDGIIHSFENEEKPIFTKEMLDQFLKIEQQETILYYQSSALYQPIATKLRETKLAKRDFDKITASLDLLENEFASPDQKPREHIIEGMLLYLEKQKIPGFSESLARLYSHLIQSRI